MRIQPPLPEFAEPVDSTTAPDSPELLDVAEATVTDPEPELVAVFDKMRSAPPIP
jgi:hypothetical protein